MLERRLSLSPKVRNSFLYALVLKEKKEKTPTRGEKGMILLATAHIEQLHERYCAFVLDQVTFRQQRARLGVVHTGRLGNPSSLNDLHVRVLPLREAHRDVDADRARILGGRVAAGRRVLGLFRGS